MRGMLLVAALFAGLSSASHAASSPAPCDLAARFVEGRGEITVENCNRLPTAVTLTAPQGVRLRLVRAVVIRPNETVVIDQDCSELPTFRRLECILTPALKPGWKLKIVVRSSDPTPSRIHFRVVAYPYRYGVWLHLKPLTG